MRKISFHAAAFFSVCILSLGTLSLFAQTAAQPTVVPGVPSAVTMNLVAEVNGDKISRSDLAAECLRLHGESELSEKIRKKIIEQACVQNNIAITQAEINAEIERMAATLDMSAKDWLDLMQNERNIKPQQYMDDIITPILSIKKLAGPQIKATEEEIGREWDTRYGPAVQVRQIMLRTREEAEKVWAEVKANPASFPSVAKNRSTDESSRPYGGLVHPIRRYTINPAIEQMLFSLQPGEISPVVEFTSEAFMVFRCEQFFPSQNVDIEAVREQLVKTIEDKKIREISDTVFGKIQNQAQIEVLLGQPQLMAQRPGVAAMVNGQPLTLHDLSEHCLARFGETVLEDMISRLIIEQACRKNNLVITEADIDAEIRQMAIKHLPLLADGQPDIARWMQMVLRENGVSEIVYRTSTIWPMIALKKLSQNRVTVSEEEVQKSFVSTYGEKVRCLAIMFPATEQRRAMEVWNKASAHRTPEYFGDLAEEYSFDGPSRTARGVIPPISRYSGAPELENEAFNLAPGEISSLFHFDDSLIILYCLGRTEPNVTDLESVRAEIMAHLYEMKQQIAMAQYYDELYRQMACDNYLSSQSQHPELEKRLQENATLPSQATLPTPAAQ